MKLSIFVTGALLAGMSVAYGAEESIPQKGVFRDAVEISNTQTKRSTPDLAKAAQNPIANMISLPLQDNINTGIGPRDETQNVLNIQPVYPFAISENWNVITRTILPVISQPDVLTGGKGRVDGVGNLNFTAFFSPAAASKVTWGVGPAVILPTASNRVLGSEKWSAGPALVVLTMPGHWVIGSLFSDVISLGGSGDDFHMFTCQYFVNYNLPKGWYLSSSPIMTANWEATGSDTWTIPLGGGVGKLFKVGKLPINVQAHAYKNIVSPTYGAEWQFRVQVQFLFPK